MIGYQGLSSRCKSQRHSSFGTHRLDKFAWSVNGD